MGPPDLKRTQKSATLHMGTRTFFICSAIEGPRAAPQDFAPPAVVGRDAVVLEAAACSNIFNRSAIVMNQCSRTGGLPASGPPLSSLTPPNRSPHCFTGVVSGREELCWRLRRSTTAGVAGVNYIRLLLSAESYLGSSVPAEPLQYPALSDAVLLYLKDDSSHGLRELRRNNIFSKN